MTIDKTEGLVAAPPTGFRDDGNVDLDVVEPMANHLHNLGVTGVFVNGTTGEGMSLCCEEREALAEEWARVIPEDMKFFVHVGHNSLKDVRRLAVHARSIEADAIGIMAPAFFRPDDVDGVVEWCARAGQVVPETPLYFYHMPSMTGVELCISDFLRSAMDQVPSLAGIKFTYEAMDDYFEALQIDDGRFDVLWGRDEMLLGALAMGARGAVGSTFNTIPELSLEMMKEFEAGHLDAARACQKKVIQVIRILAGSGSFFSALKAVMRHQGVPIRRDTRCPVDTLSADDANHVVRPVRDVLESECCVKADVPEINTPI